jgi:predicted membrane-bound dolichyl-phosphate-mannose-protein mannosyltransferase
MWFPLLLMAVAVSLEPFRIAMTVLMINRPRPARQLLAFLAGGFVMGTMVGLIVLFVLRPAVGSAHFTLPRMQIVIGALLLLYAAVVAAGVARLGSRDNSADRSAGRVMTRMRRLLNGRSLWSAGTAGLAIALPSVDYVAALALIAASGAAATVQVGAMVTFNVVAFALVEIPLLCHLAAPEWTRATLSAGYDWLRARGHRGTAALLALVGCVLVGVGVAGL